MLKTKQLRHMSAEVIKPNSATAYTSEGGEFTIQYPTILKSYASNVAVYDENTNRVYLLPDYDYSNTTTKHVHAFMQDYTPFYFMNYDKMRKDAKGAKRKYMFIENISY